MGFPGTSGKEPACQCRRHESQFNLWVRKIPWKRMQQSIPVFLPGESHGQRSLAGNSPQRSRVGHDWSDSKKKKKIAAKANIHKLGNLKQHKFMFLQFCRFKVQHECYCAKTKELARLGSFQVAPGENPLLDFQCIGDAQIPWIMSPFFHL